MKNKIILVLCLSLAFVLCSCGVSETDYINVVSERDNLQAEYDKVKSQYDQLNAEYTELLENTSDWLKLTEAEKAAQLAQAEADRIAAEEAERKAKEEQAAAAQAAVEEAQRKAEEEAAAKAEEEKRGYDTGITYDNLARDPDKYKGKKVKFTGKVLQVTELTNEIQIRLATKSDAWGGYYEDVVYLYFESSLVSSRILEDDIITIYGTAQGLHSYTTVLGANVTLPLVKVDKIDR